MSTEAKKNLDVHLYIYIFIRDTSFDFPEINGSLSFHVASTETLFIYVECVISSLLQ